MSNITKIMLTAKEELDKTINKALGVNIDAELTLEETREIIRGSGAATKQDIFTISGELNEITSKWSSSTCKGFNFWIGDNVPIDPLKYDEVIDSNIRNLTECGCNSIMLVLYYWYDKATLNLVQRQTDILINKAIDKLKGTNIEINIKPHLFWEKVLHDSDMDTIKVLFLKYKDELLRIADLFKVKGITNKFIVQNESPTTTCDSYFTSEYIDLCSKLKGKGFTVGCSMLDVELERHTFLNSLDFICCNIYPCISAKGMTETVENMSNYMFRDCNGKDYLNRYKRVKEMYKKPFYISEIGIFDDEKHLLKPYDSKIPTENTGDGSVQAKFYEATLRAFQACEWLDGVYYWDSYSGGYSPFKEARNGKPMEVLKRYWR